MAKPKKKKRSRRTLRRHALMPTKRVLEERRRLHSVSVDTPQVMDFGDPTLREAFRVWWHPYDMGNDFDELTGRNDRSVARGDTIMRHKLDPAYYRRIARAMESAFGKRGARRSKTRGRAFLASTKRARVKVVITLTYPLTERQQKVVSIDRKYPGEIFALAHDFYRELYAQDEKDGGKPGPSGNGKNGKPVFLNRSFGPVVWGHDLGDLAFESCQYRAFDKKRAKQLGAEGEFTFGIGS